eukprot:m51a1_g14283 hypothetical protein (155) ;mRNA; r:382536-387262
MLESVFGRFESRFFNYLGVNMVKTVYVYFEYDAAQTWINGVKKMIAAGQDPRNQSLLYSTLISLDFEGATGEVTFDENGDRFAPINIYRWSQGKSNIEVIGNWSIGDGVAIDPQYAPWSKRTPATRNKAKFMVDPSELEMKEEMGHGSFGTVFK